LFLSDTSITDKNNELKKLHRNYPAEP